MLFFLIPGAAINIHTFGKVTKSYYSLRLRLYIYRNTYFISLTKLNEIEEEFYHQVYIAACVESYLAIMLMSR